MELWQLITEQLHKDAHNKTLNDW